MKRNLKPAIAAIAFFAIMTVVGIESAHAQINLLEQVHATDTNPLIATTGPNTIGAGHLQLSADASWSHLSYTSESYLLPGTSVMPTYPGTIHMINSMRRNAFGGALGVRYGIGKLLELNASFGGGLNTERDNAIINNRDTVIIARCQTLDVAFGAKVHVYEGHAWVPQMALAAQLSESFVHFGDRDGFDRHTPAWAIELQLRNRLGHRWMLDYHVGFASNEVWLGSRAMAAKFTYGLMARFLASDRLLLGAGFDDGNGLFEAHFQATPSLQLKAQALVATGLGADMSTTSAYGMLGINWMF